jgi:hypothetical protein
VIGSGTLLLQYLMLRRYARDVIDLRAEENADDRRAMIGFIRNQAPNAIFFCLQGQITILLITIFGHRAGACGRGRGTRPPRHDLCRSWQSYYNIFAPCLCPL